MRIRLALLVSLASASFAIAAHASVLCETHANALFGALDEANYDAAAADFDDALRARYPASKLRADYEALPATYGKLLGRGRLHAGDVSDRTIVMAPLIFERGTLTAEVHCEADGRISDLRLEPTQVMDHP
ncbi:MAG TPA: hypothetical protein VJ696_09280 [Rhodanobacteraceae bacterium]|nr:hypothetical protein [Rhodanobacteraceae bacterium]